MRAPTILLAVLVSLCCLGLARAAEHTLTIRDNIGRAWQHEPINWDVSFAPGECGSQATRSGGPLRVLRDGKPVVAQAEVAEKHPDGSVKRATVRFIVDALAKDGATTLKLEPGQASPTGTDLALREEPGALVLQNALTAVRLVNRNAAGGPFSPILGVRTPSGKWVGGGHYATKTAKPVRSKTEVLERGPVRLAARVTTTFDNGRTHVVTVSLWSGSHAIDIDEQFDVGPDSMYKFKRYKNDRDELAWEWWQWYGDREGTAQDHPNYWVLDLSTPGFTPGVARYFGQRASDPDTTDKGNGYTLAYKQPRRLQKYLVGHTQWRPDAVVWYAVSVASDPNEDCVAVFTHSARNWRNPNIYPLPRGITLRTGANDMRVVSYAKGRQLTVQCPIGLGHRTWAIRTSTRKEMLAPAATSPTALDAERVRRCMGLDITRQWITDWDMTYGYPRLFVKPAERKAYYARFKGKDTGMSWGLGGFLNRQDKASFERAWRDTMTQADRMIKGYVTHGMDNTTGYPAWMLGYWHGVIVAGGLDNLAGSPFCTHEMTRELKKKLAIITYGLASRDAWSDKQINYGWGSMNMPVGRWGGLVVMASALSDHPMARTWLKDAGRYYKMLLDTEYAPDGTAISCPHYIGASVISFYSWIIMANNGLGPDVSKSPVLRRFGHYYMQLMKPIDPRWGIRVLLNEGDTRPGSSPFPAILAKLFKDTDPDLAGQLMQVWIDGGRDMSQGMGIPDAVIIDPTIPPRTPKLGPQVYPGFGAFLRYRGIGTPQEAYLAFVGGNFMIDHTNVDQLAFAWSEKGVPLSCFSGDMYVPFAGTALSHNTICWDVRPEGGPTPGKDRPGDWYHDNDLPWVAHKNRPRLHYEIGWDQSRQDITDTRGMVTFASDQPDAALVEGQVKVMALTEVPTAQNYGKQMAPQAATPVYPFKKPFTWTRRLLYVKAPTAEGMNYLVIRDDLGGFHERTPNFSYWSLSNDVKLDGNRAHFAGQLGVDTDLFVAVPEQPTLHKNSFTHNQCEPIVSRLHRQHYHKAFTEKQVVCRVEGRKDRGFLVVVFPRKAGEEAPVIEPWAAPWGVKVTWKGETHYVLLDTKPHPVDADGISANTSCLVAKVRDARNASLALPAGGQAKMGALQATGKGTAPVGVVGSRTTRSVDGTVRKVGGQVLTPN